MFGIVGFRLATMPNVNDLQIGSVFAVGKNVGGHHEAPRPWNEARPPTSRNLGKLSAGVSDPVQEPPRRRDAPFGEIGRLAMQPLSVRADSKTRRGISLDCVLPPVLATSSSSLAITSSSDALSPRSSCAIPSCTSRISAPSPARYCRSARRQTHARGRSIAAAILSSFFNIVCGTRTDIRGEPASSGNPGLLMTMLLDHMGRQCGQFPDAVTAVIRRRHSDGPDRQPVVACVDYGMIA
jgi:hypothetical protein